MVNRCGCMICRRSMVCRSRMYSSILRNSLIRNISNISSIIISMVVNILGTSIRKSNSVGSFNITITISSLPSIVVSTRVVIMYSVLIAVGSWLLFVHRSMIRRSCMDYGSMVNYRCVVSWSCMVSWSMMNYRCMMDY